MKAIQPPKARAIDDLQKCADALLPLPAKQARRVLKNIIADHAEDIAGGLLDDAAVRSLGRKNGRARK